MFTLIEALRRRALLRRPFPTAWLPIVDEHLPFVSAFDDDERQRFLDRLKLFAWRVRFEGVQGVEITDEVRVLIAGQAARMARNLPYNAYDHLGSVIVYPSHYKHEDKEGIILGEAHRLGQMVLSWDAVTHGIRNDHDGQNTTLHELAHVLDAQDGELDGTPLLETGYRRWAHVLSGHFLTLRDSPRRRSLLRQYGATNEAEFFAVATEAFFEKAEKLKEKAPDLYEELQRYYGVDPAGVSAQLRSS